MALDEQKPEQTQEEFSLHLQVVQKVLELMTAAFSLVAALAWNDAIQTLFTKFLGPSKTLSAKFIYALLVTGIVVWVAFRVSRIQKILDKKSKSQKRIYE